MEQLKQFITAELEKREAEMLEAEIESSGDGQDEKGLELLGTIIDTLTMVSEKIAEIEKSKK